MYTYTGPRHSDGPFCIVRFTLRDGELRTFTTRRSNEQPAGSLVNTLISENRIGNDGLSIMRDTTAEV